MKNKYYNYILPFIIGVIFIINTQIVVAQCYTPNQMGAPTTPICPNTPINLTNPQPGQARYEWDFCNENLKQTISKNKLNGQPVGLVDTSNMVLVEENGLYFIFYINVNARKLFRIDLGANPTNNQALAITDLGNSGNFFGAIAAGLSLIKHNNNWFGFASNYTGLDNSSSPDTKIIRLDFGNSITNNTPIATNLSSVASSVTNPYSITAVKFNNDFLLILGDVGASNYKLVIINIGNAPDNAIPPANVTTLTNASLYGLGWTSVYIDCNNILTVFSISNTSSRELIAYNFGTNINNTPTIINLSAYLPTGITYVSISVAKETTDLYLLLSTVQNGQIKSFSFANGNINNPPIIKDMLNNDEGLTFGITLKKYKGEFIGFYSEFTGGNKGISSIYFPNTCGITNSSSTLENPVPITYNNETGAQNITLDVFDASNNLLSSYISTINIGAIIAKQKEAFACLGSSIQFVNESLGNFSNISSWTWNFGDGTPTSALEAPTHTYISGGIYNVTLTATTISGCTTTETKQVKISSGITAAFNNVPNACVGQKINFQDQTIFSVLPADVTTGYYWNFGDGTYSPFPNPEKTYTTNGTYTIKLDVRDKGGCTSTISKTIQIISAPLANFTMPLTACVGENITLTDTSIGTLTQWNWVFEGAGVSAVRNPTVKFDIEGLYDVTLTVRSASNCETKITKEIRILPIQSIDFSFQNRIRDNKELLFTNLSNITNTNNTFSWNFGDGTPTTNTINPVHIYAQEGFYNVSLRLSNTSGCNQIITKNIFVGTQIADIALEKLVLKDQNMTNKKLEISVKNLGNTVIDTFSVNIYADDKFLFTEKITANIAVNTSKIITLNTTILSQNLEKISFVCVKIIRKDENLANNKVCISFASEFVVFEPFPNPAQNKITLRYFLPENNGITSNINLIIYDMTGKQIQQSSLEVKGVNNIEYDISTFANGMYVFSFEYAGKIIRKKVAIN